MQLTNSQTRYGAVTKGFHWLTALLILTAIPLGLVGNEIAEAIKNPDIATTDTDITRAALLFSLHKTIGIASFFVALARILWAVSQPKPGLLNGDKPLESLAAECVHWLLYGSLLLVPLSGWIHHAATAGFAPIWWPFGQSLPFIPKNQMLADFFAHLHLLFAWILIVCVAAHIAGALKHHIIDRDATLRRMLPGRTEAQPTPRQPSHASAILGAVLVWSIVLGGGAATGFFSDTKNLAIAEADEEVRQDTAGTIVSETLEDDVWLVKEGSLGITIRQLGSEIAGTFADWQAAIRYNEETGADGNEGSVEVTVTIASLTLGTVTNQAMGSDFFDAETFPQAQFSGTILREGSGHIARGTLTIKGNSVPLDLPFELDINGAEAKAAGAVTVDRRDFGIGAADEGNVGAEVVIRFELLADRASGS